MDITEVTIIHHIALVFALLWALVSLGWGHPIAFFIALLYLYKVNERYSLKLRRRLQFEERKNANQRRLLSDSESVRWLNHAVEKVWPICMENIMSQQFLLPIIPWFLDKFKPWTARKAVVQNLYMGRSPPIFTEIRVLRESSDDDHLVLELGMNFLSADDMSATLAVQLRKRLGFGIWAKMHVTGMHVEGKVLVGIKFLRHWPFLGRVRVCFVEPPYFQMTVKPIFNHGVDVTELPGIAGWLDKLLAVAFEQTLVEPNMLVVDVEKFASSPKDGWFTIDEKPPIAYAKVEVIEAADMKPSDMNGLADPYVKGQLGPYRFQTKIQKKTLAPKWLEEFNIPISSWEGPNDLVIRILDKDHIFDDTLGDCSVSINDLRGGQRHDKWLPLRNIKMGRLHLGVTVLEDEDAKGTENLSDDEDQSKTAEATVSRLSSMAKNSSADASSKEGQNVADEYEAINIEGQKKTGIWVHHPGSDLAQTWEPRKGSHRHPETQLHREDTSSPRSPDRSHANSSDGQVEGKHIHRIKTLGREIRKFGSLVHRSLKGSPRDDGEEAVPSPRPNLLAVGENGMTAVRFIVDDDCIGNSGDRKANKGSSSSPEKGEVESPGKGHVKNAAKSIIKQANKSGHGLKNVLSRKGSDKTKEDGASETGEGDGSRGSDVSDDTAKDDPFIIGGSPIRITSRPEHGKESAIAG